MKFEQIRYEVNRHILTITLNRPEKLNGFTPVMANELVEAFNQADSDDEVRVVIVTGAGRTFCAGDDISSGGFDDVLQSKETPEEHRDGGGRVVLRIYDMKKPVIAAINGHAVGVGITMTLPMDIRILSDKAKVGFVFTRRGIVLEACSSWFLPRIVGITRASEWGLTGRVFSAQEAYEGGLVARMVPPEEVLKTTQEFAREIADNTSAVSVALTRQLLWRMLGADHPMEAHRMDSKCVYYMAKSVDAKEGVESFLQKRPAAFKLKPSKDMPPFYPWWKDRFFK